MIHMLLKVALKNFRSFKDTATLDLVSSSKVQNLSTHLHKFDDMKVLKNAAIYGANASGKTNFCRALKLLQETLRDSKLSPSASNYYCKIDEKGIQSDTTIDVQFEMNGKFFDYGFSAVLAERRITAEWLYVLRPCSGNGWNSDLLFDRRDGMPVQIGENFLKTLGNDKQRLEVYASDISGSANLLFLSELNRGDKISNESKMSVFVRVYEYLTQNIKIVGAGELVASSYFLLASESDFADLSSLFASFDTGIEEIVKKQITVAELGEMVPAPLFSQIQSDLEKHAGTSSCGVIRLPDELILLDVSGGPEPKISKISSRHGGSFYDYSFAEESAGTQRLFDFIDLLLGQNADTTFIVDEINLSLHSMLSCHLLKQFNRAHASDKAQLIFTTHESAMMDAQYLRKDEVWFVDRFGDGESCLYPLDSFDSVRTDTRVQKAYLEGRYGGIPILTDCFCLNLGDNDAAID